MTTIINLHNLHILESSMHHKLDITHNVHKLLLRKF